MTYRLWWTVGYTCSSEREFLAAKHRLLPATYEMLDDALRRASQVGRAGGEALAARVANCLAGLTPVPTEVRATGVEDNAVLLGAVLTALDLTRERVFSPAS